MFDTQSIARLEFASLISIHILFSALVIGLIAFMLVMEITWLVTGKRVYARLVDDWRKIFAVGFLAAFVTGLAMRFQFGHLWSPITEKTAPIIGAFTGSQVIYVFYAELLLLAVILFGRRKMGVILFSMAQLLMMAGTIYTTFWVVSLNSWMHTPAGFAFNELGQFTPYSWPDIIFSPSFPLRFAHMMIASYLAVALIIAAVGARQYVRARKDAGLKMTMEPAKIMLNFGLWAVMLLAPLQIAVGHFHGKTTAEYQPAKMAALEGQWEGQNGAPWIVFGLPDEEAEVTKSQISIPYLGSLLLTHDPNGKVAGLKDWQKNERPPVMRSFVSFRIMVFLGMAMLFLGFWGLWARLKNRLFESHALHKMALYMGPAGFIAMVAGWVATESGRQPWVIYGQLLTADAHLQLPATAVWQEFIMMMGIFGSIGLLAMGVIIWQLRKPKGVTRLYQDNVKHKAQQADIAHDMAQSAHERDYEAPPRPADEEDLRIWRYEDHTVHRMQSGENMSVQLVDDNEFASENHYQNWLPQQDSSIYALDHFGENMGDNIGAGQDQDDDCDFQFSPYLRQVNATSEDERQPLLTEDNIKHSEDANISKYDKRQNLAKNGEKHWFKSNIEKNRSAGNITSTPEEQDIEENGYTAFGGPEHDHIVDFHEVRNQKKQAQTDDYEKSVLPMPQSRPGDEEDNSLVGKLHRYFNRKKSANSDVAAPAEQVPNPQEKPMAHNHMAHAQMTQNLMNRPKIYDMNDPMVVRELMAKDMKEDGYNDEMTPPQSGDGKVEESYTPSYRHIRRIANGDI